MNNNDSKANEKVSEVKEAADHADVQQIEKNLQHDKQEGKPESLSKSETTPFIDEQSRTDK